MSTRYKKRVNSNAAVYKIQQQQTAMQAHGACDSLTKRQKVQLETEIKRAKFNASRSPVRVACHLLLAGLKLCLQSPLLGCERRSHFHPRHIELSCNRCCLKLQALGALRDGVLWIELQNEKQNAPV